MSEDPYIASVRRAVGANGLLRDSITIWANLRQLVAAGYPLDVQALMSARVEEMQASTEIVVGAQVLALRGYDYNMAETIAKKLHEDFPDFTPERVMLSPREVLVEEFGSVTGNLLIDTLVDPENQPVLYELLFGDVRPQTMLCKAVERTACIATMINRTDTFKVKKRGLKPEVLGVWELRDAKNLPAWQAIHEYHRLTGSYNLERVVPVISLGSQHVLAPYPNR